MASFRKVQLSDVSHVRVYYDQDMYAAHPNRGGIWNFGNGEIAVAHLLKPVDYSTGQGVHHGYSTISGSGVMLNRSFDGGQTWPQEHKKWIWHNDRCTEEIRCWLYDNPGDREAIDMSHPDAIMHFGITHYLRRTAGSEPDPINHNNTFCLRSKDRGRTWESKPSMISPLSFLDGLYVANLGYIKFPNGVFGHRRRTLFLRQLRSRPDLGLRRHGGV